MRRVYVDYNTIMQDPEERVLLNAAVFPELERMLIPGGTITLYDEEFEVEARVVREGDRWLARPDWTTRRDVPTSIEAVTGDG